MNRRNLLRPLLAGLALVGAPALAQDAAVQKAAAATASKGVTIARAQLAVFQPLPKRFESPGNPITPAKVELGRMLYYDTRLSKNQDVSCNSCHDLASYGVDGKSVSEGHKKQVGNRNSPTVYNAGGHVAQFWDGRAADLEAQAKGPVLNPVEMAMPDEARVVETLKSIPGYVKAFKKAFPGKDEPVTYDNMAKAIGAFERQLITPSRFDKFLAGNDKALNDAEKLGLQKFLEQGCQACHSGPAVGGGSFQKLGLVKPYPEQKDQGRYEHTKSDTDKMMFRVPSLRNVARTGPYFHDGSVKELPTAVRLMAEHQFGRAITDEEVSSIITFLDSLTGELPMKYISMPKLPPSGPGTPKPDPT